MSSLHLYTVQQLWKQLTGELDSKQPLVQVAMWALGEFADLLNTADINSEDYVEIKESDVVDVCEQIMSSNLMVLVTKEYTLAALTKLSVRFADSAARIKRIVDLYGCDHSVELQQRAVEFSALFTKYDNLRPSVLERMPPIPNKREMLQNGQATQEELCGEENGLLSNLEETADIVNKHSIPAVQSNTDVLLDLLGDSLMAPQVPSSNAVANNVAIGNDVLDLLGLGGGGGSNATNHLHNNTAPQIPSVAPTLPPSSTLIDGIFNDTTSTNSINSTPNIPSIVAFEKNDLKIVFSFERPLENDKLTVISAVATNATPAAVEDFLLQAAVPKVCNYYSY